ncbi:MAG: hypothetical protein JNL70_13005 [Saprospiraceae bacterium]|nr:hypothetical protein [Saprospiraceae bacterium]
MAKNNVRAITPESPQTFDEALANLESTIAAEVPITAEDKKGKRATEKEMSKLDFIINNVEKVDPELPKSFDNNVFADTKALLNEKKRQLSELERITTQIENQIAVIKIRYKTNLQILYASSEASVKRDDTLKYIYTNIQECYARNKSEEDKNGDNKTNKNTDKSDDTPK